MLAEVHPVKVVCSYSIASFSSFYPASFLSGILRSVSLILKKELETMVCHISLCLKWLPRHFYFCRRPLVWFKQTPGATTTFSPTPSSESTTCPTIFVSRLTFKI